MKKKILLVTILTSLITTLSACSLTDLFDSYTEGGGPGFQPVYSEIVASSKEPISDVSTPPADNDKLELQAASCNYGDYVNNSIYSFSATPSLGTAKLLVIPVWFNDSNKFIKDANKENVREDIYEIYFGDNESIGWRSVKTYYEEESLGALNMTGTVSAWYEVDRSYEYFKTETPDDYSGVPKTTAIVEDAVDWYFENHLTEKRSDYDCNNDGYLDGVMLIYGAPDYDTLNKQTYDNLWAYCYWVQDPSVQSVPNPGVNAFFWASYDFMYSSTVAISRAGTRYGAGDTTHCKLDSHTYIHEMGHMFGLEDYYDYSNYAYSPAGGFSMQDYNVGGHDPFSSYALGWGKAYIPTEDVTINLNPFATSGEMILLTPEWNKFNSPFDEYILLEYFTDKGLNELDTTYGYMSATGKAYPMGTKEYGIRVWHVDARLLYTLTGQFNPNKVTTNPKYSTGRVTLMMSNTFDDGTDYTRQYVSILSSDPSKEYYGYYDSKYANYNLLQVIHNNTKTSYKSKEAFGAKSLFKAGDSFSMETYQKQFYNTGKLDSGLDLGFTFEVNACNNDYASITIKKL